ALCGVRRDARGALRLPDSPLQHHGRRPLPVVRDGGAGPVEPEIRRPNRVAPVRARLALAVFDSSPVTCRVRKDRAYGGSSDPAYNQYMLLDTFNRPLRNLRLSVTDRCNLRCEYCMPEDDYVWLPREDVLHFEETSALVEVFLSLGVDKVRLTGGEPLLRRDVPSLVRLISSKPGLKDLALTTNGVLLADQVDALKAAGLRRVTVSLDTLRRDRFLALTRVDQLAAVHTGIAAAHRVYGRFKIDTVVIRGVNDEEVADLIEYGKSVDAEVRFIEYMDVGGASRWSPERVFS